MKFAYPSINYVFDTEIKKVNTLIIENQSLLCSLLEDIQNQLSGYDGKSVLSVNTTIKDMNKNLELISQFVPFDINQRTLLNKIYSELEKIAVNEEHFSKTAKLISDIESYFISLSFECPANLSFANCNIGSFIKAISPTITDDFTSLGEKIIDYMELVTDLIKQEKLFVFLNLRSFISDEQAELFMCTVLSHGLHCLMIESSERAKLAPENRVLVDVDLCEVF